MEEEKVIQLPDTQSRYSRLKEILDSQGYTLTKNYKTFGVTKQQMRLFDIFVFSPFLFWASTKTENRLAKYGLITLGFTTMLYNAINYKKEKQKK